MDYFTIKRNSKTWHDAWEKLADDFGSTTQPCPECNEDWMFMCCEIEENGMVVAVFKHRHHPFFGEEESWFLYPSYEIDAEQAFSDMDRTGEEITKDLSKFVMKTKIDLIQRN